MKPIEQLRRYFKVTTACFEMQNKIQLAFNEKVIKSEMQKLHELALLEIEKETPSMDEIDKLLQRMETQAEINSMPKPNPNFKKGTI